MRKGFTLIELMVVVVVIGVITALSIYGFTRFLPNYTFQQCLGGFTRFYYREVHRFMGSDTDQWIFEIDPGRDECYSDSLNAPVYRDTFRFSDYGVDVQSTGSVFIRVNKDGSVVAPDSFTVVKSANGKTFSRTITINKLGEVSIK
ncbi:hypothetical protein DRQ17_03955 [bacterium]|nr:MAG: hypothetical protein DRQ17_03955 [bacterium]